MNKETRIKIFIRFFECAVNKRYSVGIWLSPLIDNVEIEKYLDKLYRQYSTYVLPHYYKSITENKYYFKNGSKIILYKKLNEGQRGNRFNFAIIDENISKDSIDVIIRPKLREYGSEDKIVENSIDYIREEIKSE